MILGIPDADEGYSRNAVVVICNRCLCIFCMKMINCTIYPFLIWQWIFSLFVYFYLFPCSLSRLLPDWIISNRMDIP